MNRPIAANLEIRATAEGERIAPPSYSNEQSY